MRSKPSNLLRWLLCIISLFALLAVPARGQSQNTPQNWQAINGPLADGGYVASMVAAPSTPNTVYALVQDRWEERLYVSTDAADHWQRVQSFPSYGPHTSNAYPFDFIQVDPVDDQLLYAYDGFSSYLQRSRDGGQTWETILQQPVHVLQPVGAGRVYAAWYEQGGSGTAASTYVFGRSDDDGEHWETTTFGSASLLFVYADSSQPDLVYVGGGMPGPKLALWRSLNGGEDWQDLSGSPSGSFSITRFVIDPTHPGVMVVETNSDGIYRSADDGQTWTKTWEGGFNLTRTDGSLVFAQQTYDPVHERSAYSIYHSVDGGQTWWQSQDRLPDVPLFVDDPTTAGRMYAGTRGYGVWRSDTSGGEWAEHNDGIQVEADVSYLTFAPSDPKILYAVSQYPRPGIYRSDDRGNTWGGKMPMDPKPFSFQTVPDWVSTSIQVGLLAVDPQDPDNALAGGYDGLFAWEKTANKWLKISRAYGVHDIAFAPNQAGIFCAVGVGQPKSLVGTLACTDQEDSFHSVKAYPIPFIDGVFAVAFDPVNSKRIFAAGLTIPDSNAVIGVSEDGGVTWRKVFDQDSGFSHMRLTFSPVNPNQIIFEYHDSIYISTDYGEHWKVQEGSSIESGYRIWFDALGSMYRLGYYDIYQQLPGQDSWSNFWTSSGSSDDDPADFVLLPGEPEALLVARRDGLFLLDLPVIRRLRLPVVLR